MKPKEILKSSQCDCESVNCIVTFKVRVNERRRHFYLLYNNSDPIGTSVSWHYLHKRSSPHETSFFQHLIPVSDRRSVSTASFTYICPRQQVTLHSNYSFQSHMTFIYTARWQSPIIYIHIHHTHPDPSYWEKRCALSRVTYFLYLPW